MPGTLVNGTDRKELSYFYEIGVQEKCLRHLRILHVSNSDKSRHSSKRNTFEDDDSSVRLKTCLTLAGLTQGSESGLGFGGFNQGARSASWLLPPSQSVNSERVRALSACANHAYKF